MSQSVGQSIIWSVCQSANMFKVTDQLRQDLMGTNQSVSQLVSQSSDQSVSQPACSKWMRAKTGFKGTNRSVSQLVSQSSHQSVSQPTCSKWMRVKTGLKGEGEHGGFMCKNTQQFFPWFLVHFVSKWVTDIWKSQKHECGCCHFVPCSLCQH